MYIIILTDQRYIKPKTITPYIQNILDEERILGEALAAEGLTSVRKAWDDELVNWLEPKAIIFRTTWDYFERFQEFSVWLDKVTQQTTLLNSAELIRWNIDKHYLRDLEAKGTNICKSFFVEIGSQTTLYQEFKKLNCKDAILKPCISGAARHTYKLSEANIFNYEDVFQQLIKKEAMMLQPFQYSVTQKGEVSFMVFGGKFTHAVLKKAKAGDFRVQDDFGGTLHDYEASAKEIAFVEQAVRNCLELPMYARIDVMWDNKGALAVSELELIEPELWFRRNPESAKILAQSIKKRLQGVK